MKKLTLLTAMVAASTLVACTNQGYQRSAQVETKKVTTTNTTTTASMDAPAPSVPASEQPMSDTTITAKVKSQFMTQDLFTNKDVASMTIHVKTINRVVYLTGTADNQDQAKNAVRIAQGVDGVKDVVSNVMVVR